jgi:anti-sigma regulatory factor (Ser/Thr protein kinase)
MSRTAADPKPAQCAPGSLHPRPVRGSACLRLAPAQPRPRAAWAILLPPAPASARTARHETTMFLAACRDITEDFTAVATLVVSELVTNASTAMTSGPVEGIASVDLSLRLFDGHLLIEVTDSSPRPPRPRLAPDPEAESTRGLAVVHHYSQGDWGWFRRNGRKVVFARLPTAPEPDDDG